MAEEGESLPRELWPVVNLLLVECDGRIAHRVGVGKVMMNAWADQRTPVQKMILV
jgi:hypothetical protein